MGFVAEFAVDGLTIALLVQTLQRDPGHLLAHFFPMLVLPIVQIGLLPFLRTCLRPIQATSKTSQAFSWTQVLDCVRIEDSFFHSVNVFRHRVFDCTFTYCLL